MCNYSKWRGECEGGERNDLADGKTLDIENDGERFGILGYLLGVNIE